MGVYYIQKNIANIGYDNFSGKASTSSNSIIFRFSTAFGKQISNPCISNSLWKRFIIFFRRNLFWRLNFMRKQRVNNILKLLIICNIFFVYISIVIPFFSEEKILLSLQNDVSACSRAVRALCVWRIHMLGVLECFTCSCALWTCRAYVLDVLHKNGVLGVLQKMACLAYLAFFIEWWA